MSQSLTFMISACAIHNRLILGHNVGLNFFFKLQTLKSLTEIF